MQVPAGSPTEAAAAAHWALYQCLPFAAMLLSIAVLPLAAPHFWESNRNKLIVSLVLGVPVAVLLVVTLEGHGAELVIHSMKEYVAFIALLAALFVITGGIHLKGELPGTPLANTVFLGIGTILASFIGTTGASVLLVRPLLRANETRVRKAHIGLFFIFMVSNAGGMLTPLGDPPLFLGYLRGVPFLWTFRLIGPWALANAVLLLVFNVFDQVLLNREEKELPGSQLEEAMQVEEKLEFQGKRNFVFLFLVVGIIFGMGHFGERYIHEPDLRLAIQVLGMIAAATISFLVTPSRYHAANRFTWGPIIEVAVLFFGIFLTMVPALQLLETRGAAMGVRHPWQFFWATGALSSFLDNAPTYLTFGSLATGVVNGMEPAAHLSADHLGALLHYPEGVKFLTAISCGAVFMGANTYIGNGPNFMVKAIAEHHGVKMPSFFGYMLWSGAILIPIFVVVTLVFFRG
jgi:Na+/H+ antiporter NhaD/arsenite permease-like protein